MGRLPCSVESQHEHTMSMAATYRHVPQVQRALASTKKAVVAPTVSRTLDLLDLDMSGAGLRGVHV